VRLLPLRLRQGTAPIAPGALVSYGPHTRVDRIRDSVVRTRNRAEWSPALHRSYGAILCSFSFISHHAFPQIIFTPQRDTRSHKKRAFPSSGVSFARVVGQSMGATNLPLLFTTNTEDGKRIDAQILHCRGIIRPFFFTSSFIRLWMTSTRL